MAVHTSFNRCALNLLPCEAGNSASSNAESSSPHLTVDLAAAEANLSAMMHARIDVLHKGCNEQRVRPEGFPSKLTCMGRQYLQSEVQIK